MSFLQACAEQAGSATTAMWHAVSTVTLEPGTAAASSDIGLLEALASVGERWCLDQVNTVSASDSTAQGSIALVVSKVVQLLMSLGSTQHLLRGAALVWRLSLWEHVHKVPGVGLQPTLLPLTPQMEPFLTRCGNMLSEHARRVLRSERLFHYSDLRSNPSVVSVYLDMVLQNGPSSQDSSRAADAFR